MENFLFTLLIISCFVNLVAFVFSVKEKWNIWKGLRLFTFVLSLVTLGLFLKSNKQSIFSNKEAVQEIGFVAPEFGESPQIVSVFSWGSGVIEVR